MVPVLGVPLVNLNYANAAHVFGAEMTTLKSITGLYFSPFIPDKKLTNACSSYAPNVDPASVIMLFDTTVFGSAAEGLLLTEHSIFSKDVDGTVSSFSLSKIRDITVTKGSVTQQVLVNDENILSVAKVGYKQCLELCSYIEKVMAEGASAINEIVDVIDDREIEHAFYVENNNKKALKIMGWVFAGLFAFIIIGILFQNIFMDDDGDGILNSDDCAPNNAAIRTSPWTDSDCDGIEDYKDCDPKDPKNTLVSFEDRDCDGIPNNAEVCDCKWKGECLPANDGLCEKGSPELNLDTKAKAGVPQKLPSVVDFEVTTNSLGMEMVAISGGTFTMGHESCQHTPLKDIPCPTDDPYTAQDESADCRTKKDKITINNPEVKKSIKIAEKIMKGQGRILVRKSGTESKIRVMGESDNKKLLNKCVNIISKKIK